MKLALFTAAAEADVEEAFQWYEAQRPGLGAAFRHALDVAVAAVESRPGTNKKPMVGRASRRVLRLIAELEAEGRL